MHTKKQTAVEWLFKKLWDTPKDKLDWYAILAQAKEIEKEQIGEAFLDGVYRASPSDLDYENFEETAQQYYNETYERNRDYKTL